MRKLLFILGLCILSNIVDAGSIQYIEIIDLTGIGYEEILIYQNNNMSIRYITNETLNTIFDIEANETMAYNFVMIPKTQHIIMNMDENFLDYVFFNMWYFLLILIIIVLVIWIIKKK